MLGLESTHPACFKSRDGQPNGRKDGRTEGRKKPDEEVGTPPKNARYGNDYKMRVFNLNIEILRQFFAYYIKAYIKTKFFDLTPPPKKSSKGHRKIQKSPKWDRMKTKDRAAFPKPKLIVYIDRFQKSF